MEYYSALTGRKFFSMCTTWMNFSQNQKDRNYNGGYHGLKGGELNGELLFNEYNFSFIKTKSVMEVDGGDGCINAVKEFKQETILIL